MKNRFLVFKLVLLFVFLSAPGLVAQEKKPDNTRRVVVEKKMSDVDLAIVKAQNSVINKLMNKTFATVATGQGDGANLKTYGSFEPVNGAYKFNVFGSAGSEERPVLFNVAVKGSINGNNIAVLFDQSEFSSGAAISGKIHFPVGFAKITTDLSDEERISNEIAALKRKADVKLAMLGSGVDLAFVSNQKSAEENRLAKLMADSRAALAKVKQYQLTINRGGAGAVTALDNSVKWNKVLRGIDTLMVNTRYKIDSLKFLMVSNHLQDFAAAEKAKIDAALAAKKDSLWLTLPVQSQELSWISVVGSYGRNKYYTFSDKLPLSQQYLEVKQDIFFVGLEFTRFISSGSYYAYGSGEHEAAKKPGVSLLNLGAVWMGGSDIDDYSTTELSTSRKFASGDTTNTLGKKYNVYTDAVTNYRAFKLYGHYYYFFGKNNSYAVHPFADVELRESGQNPFGMGCGFVFSLKNKKDNSVFNVELYGKFRDMGKALPQIEYAMLRRNEVGLNFAVPLNLPKKK
jgi:hypothetical protein